MVGHGWVMGNLRLWQRMEVEKVEVEEYKEMDNTECI